MSPRRRRQCGFTLVSALFLLVVLAGLAVYAVSVASVQHTTSMLEVKGSRAHFAASAGLEWAFHEIVNNAAGGLDCSPGSVTIALSEAALTGYAVQIECVTEAVSEGSQSYTLFTLTASASHGSSGQPDFVSRTILAKLAY